jgi:hypothetical protein
MFCGLVTGSPQVNKKTHDRCRPWVFVEIPVTFDKRLRRRRLRRRPAAAARLVGCSTFAGILVNGGKPVKPPFFEIPQLSGWWRWVQCLGHRGGDLLHTDAGHAAEVDRTSAAETGSASGLASEKVLPGISGLDRTGQFRRGAAEGDHYWNTESSRHVHRATVVAQGNLTVLENRHKLAQRGFAREVEHFTRRCGGQLFADRPIQRAPNMHTHYIGVQLTHSPDDFYEALNRPAFGRTVRSRNIDRQPGRRPSSGSVLNRSQLVIQPG